MDDGCFANGCSRRRLEGEDQDCQMRKSRHLLGFGVWTLDLHPQPWAWCEIPYLIGTDYQFCHRFPPSRFHVSPDFPWREGGGEGGRGRLRCGMRSGFHTHQLPFRQHTEVLPFIKPPRVLKYEKPSVFDFPHGFRTYRLERTIMSSFKGPRPYNSAFLVDACSS